MKGVSRGYLFGIGSALIFSLVSILGKIIMKNGVEPGVLIFWQYTGVLFVLSLYFLITKKSLKLESITLLPIAAMSILANLCFYTSMGYIGAGLATLLLYFASAITALFFFFTGIRGIKKLEWLAIILALLGSAFSLEIFNGFSLNLIGIGAGLLSALAYSLYGIGIDLKLKDENFMKINFYIALQGLVIISLFNFSKDVVPWAIEGRDILALVIIGLIAGVVPNYMSFHSIRLIGADKTSVVMSMELPATVILAFFILQERMGLVQALGIVLVLASVILLRSLEGPEGVED
ncbi:MAG: DMT family transporter [Tissierellia bacterium]|nr:DMT family transporter [Tissierellia bacterium]